MTKEEIADVLAQHKAWREGNGGKRANLSGADLSRANLSGANLSGANLSGADFLGAKIHDKTAIGILRRAP
ncbi:MAG: pentapeptide repeat-containing protein, partial [Pseudomonadota bacterium]